MAEPTKLTKRAVDALKATGREFTVTDTEVKGFYLRVGKTGEKTYGFRYKRRDQTRRMKIGDVAVMTADEARRAAMDIRAAVNRGEDPARLRRDERETETMDDLWALYLERHAIPKKRPRSVDEDRRLWRLHLSPAFGKEAVKDVTRRNIGRFMARKKDTPIAANRAASLLSKMMSLAVNWDLRDRNPCEKMDRYTETEAERKALTMDETKRLLEAITHEAETGSEGGALALELLLFSGARRGEVINATWDQFRAGEAGSLVWALQATQNKQKKLNLKPLAKGISARLLAWKQKNRAIGVNWVFPSPKNPQQPWSDLKSVWNRVRAHAGLEHIRAHDIRHDFISAAVMDGMSLEVAGRFAGHANTATTRRYAHLEEAVLQDVADRREAALDAARNAVSAEVVPMRSSKPNGG